MLQEQFAHPRGRLGLLVGWLMARTNRPLYQWTFEQLQLHQGERVLEIGSGSGKALEQALLLEASQALGIDISRTMVKQAARLHASHIRVGRIAVVQASVDFLPCCNTAFDACYSINSIQFWPDQIRGLREVRHVLQPKGRLALTL